MLRELLLPVAVVTFTIAAGSIGTTTANRDGAVVLAAGIPGDVGESVPTGSGAQAITAGCCHTCALLDIDTLKCWGLNDDGQLGQGDTDERGDAPGEMGDHLPPIDLGTGRSAVAVAAGWTHTCALLDNDAVKCWGENSPNGALGQGDTDNRGDGPGEMGDRLPAIDLGTGRSAREITAGTSFTCALLDDASVKCWGANYGGQLGQGDTNNRGDNTGEMGDNLPAIDLGTGRTARAISAGGWHACGLLDDYSVKCWGGGFGYGDTNDRGDNTGEMGDNLPAIDLGTGRTARAISAGGGFTCAVLDNGTVKCWGWNFEARLGLGDTNDRGDEPGEMGDNLPAVDLGTGRTAQAIAAGYDHACALLDDDTVKCWGLNHVGQLGQGDTNDRGDEPGEMGDNLPAIDLGTGRTATAITAGRVQTCVLLDDRTVICFGIIERGPIDFGTGLRPAVFTATDPLRVVDTRDGLGFRTEALDGTAPVPAGTSIAIPVAGLVPAFTAAVVVNLTTTRAVEAGFITVHPCDEAVPEASNLNYRPGVDTANLVIAPVSDNGTICVYTSATTDLIADITGYSTTGYQPLSPTRLADTRHTTPQPAGTTLLVALPDDGGHAVTVTATRATNGGYLTAYDCTQPRPDTSTVNYVPGADAANLTLATGAELCVYTSSNVDIVVDHHGRIGGAAVVAQRLVDTRQTAPLAAGDTLTIPDTTGGGTSRAINITATQPGAASHLTLHPCNTAPPPTSNLNVAPGHDTANLTIIPTTQDTCITTTVTTHLIIDLTATIN